MSLKADHYEDVDGRHVFEIRVKGWRTLRSRVRDVGIAVADWWDDLRTPPAALEALTRVERTCDRMQGTINLLEQQKRELEATVEEHVHRESNLGVAQTDYRRWLEQRVAEQQASVDEIDEREGRLIHRAKRDAYAAALERAPRAEVALGQ